MKRRSNSDYSNRRFPFSAGLIFFVATWFPQHAIANDKMVVECEAEIALKEGESIYSAAVDLGRLPVSKVIVVKVTLKNPFDEGVKFSGVSNKCACKQFKSYNSLIPANGETVAEFTFNTPARNRSVDVDTSISLVENGKAVVKLNMDYELEGLLAFSELLGVVRFKSTEPTKTQQIPFVYSSPIEFDNIAANLTGKLEKASIEISKTENGGLLTVTIPNELIAKGNVRGEVHLTYPGTDQLDCYYLSIKDARKNEISPKVIQFRQKPDSWQANAIVKIAGFSEPNAENDGEASELAELIRCEWQGDPVMLNVKPLKNNTFRVQLSLSEIQVEQMKSRYGDDDSATNTLDWKINNGRKTTTSTTEFSILTE